ncbi:MAG: hypothetical protein R3330_05535, partial [Saprospiraceae bacterium]|nr:hypothetical protein [Saprospiraceae bacterium]
MKRILCVVLAIAASAGYLTAQNWQLCPGEGNTRVDTMTYLASAGLLELGLDYRVTAEVRHPSCPHAADGRIELLEVEILSTTIPPVFSQVLSPDMYSLSLYSAEVGVLSAQGGVFTDLAAGSYQFQLTVGDLIPVRWAAVDLEEPPAPVLTVLKSNVSCPGASDGIIAITDLQYATDPPSAVPGASVEWSDGGAGLTRAGLTAGLYEYTYSYPFNGHRCCIEGAVDISENACSALWFETDFSAGIPVEMFVSPPDAVQGIGGQAVYQSEGLLTVVVFGPTTNINVSFDWEGVGETFEWWDFFGYPLGSEPINGSGHYSFWVPGSDDPIVLAWIGINNDRLDNIVVVDYDAAPAPLLFSPSPPPGLMSDTTVENVQVCGGGPVILDTGAGVSGGETPYTFWWDMNSDGSVEADSLNHPIMAGVGDTTMVTLTVTDFVGQQATHQYTLIAPEQVTITYDVPAFNITNASDTALTLCHDQPPFTITPLQPGVTLLLNQVPMKNNTVPTDTMGTGTHIITAVGEECDAPAVLLVNILDDFVVELDPNPAPFYQCVFNYDLNAMLTTNARGIWAVDDIAVGLNGIVTTDAFSGTGVHELKYVVGGNPCLISDEVAEEVEEEPMVELPDTTVLVCSEDQIEELCVESFVSGDIWSPYLQGGDINCTGWMGTGVEYIGDPLEGRVVFNPAGLPPGTYPVIYQPYDSCSA